MKKTGVTIINLKNYENQTQSSNSSGTSDDVMKEMWIEMYNITQPKKRISFDIYEKT